MKFFAAFVAILAVAVASPLKPATSELAQLEAIIAAINSPSTDPATATLLEAQLAAIIGATNPISVGAPIVSVPETVVLPAPGVLPIVPEQPSPIAPIRPPSPISPINPIVPPFPIDSISPIVMPMPVVEPTPVVKPVVPSPVVVGDVPAGSSPLVQIIVNVNEAAPTPVQAVDSVSVVDEADNTVSPVQVVSPVEVSPVQVAETIVPGPVNIVDHPVSVEVPVVVDPVAVGTPILPAPVMTLPEELN